MNNFLLALAKLILGVFFAFILMSLVGVATARYFMAKLAVSPEKPIFANGTSPVEEPAPAPSTNTASTTTQAPSKPPVATPQLEPGAYKAVVIQPIGLVLREGPGRDFPQLGGVEYNEQIIVLGESENRQWLRIRLPVSGQRGWVKAGNTQKIN
ncbi:MAG: SH3 domain-containing protein [Leptolyngbyaceae cyanobacterium MO_188.B28]|nr:SH3 domain-containing protein [Leptolyngbyaceae cyanobacterium MO_188.B28]